MSTDANKVGPPQVVLQLRMHNIPALPGAVELLRQGIRSTAHAGNSNLAPCTLRQGADVSEVQLALLMDPQTSGAALQNLQAVTCIAGKMHQICPVKSG